MPRKSLRPHLNQIRTWTRQGRTDAWVAHQLDVTVQQIATFKRESGLLDDDAAAAGAPSVDIDEDIDLRAEDDARIAAPRRRRARSSAEPSDRCAAPAASAIAQELDCQSVAPRR